MLQNHTKLEGMFVIPAKKMPLFCLLNNGGFTKKRTKKQVKAFYGTFERVLYARQENPR